MARFGRRFPIPPLIRGYGLGMVAVTGTAIASIDEDDITTGGKTIILTLTNDTWKAAGTANIGDVADTQALIDGLDSAQSEGTGWNAEVRDKEVVGAVVRTSDTVATITLSAAAAYDVTAQETITVTVPTDVLNVSGLALVAVPTFTVDFVSVSTVPVLDEGMLTGGLQVLAGGLA